MATSIAGGTFILKGNVFFTGKYILLTTNYLKYKSSLAYAANNKNLTASIASIFSDNNLIVEDNNGNAKSVPVLLYHGVVENPDGSNILLEDFKNQMFVLKRAGWQTIMLEDFYKFIKGEKKLPDKSFLLTFDDGRKDSYYPVDPILKALDYNAVIFIITKYSLEDKSGNYYLSKNELKQMLKSGRWEIQVHTREGHNTYKISPDGERGYFYSNKLWFDNENRLETEEEFKNRILADFIVAKNDIEQNLGNKVISFAYPFGDFGQDFINFPKAEKIVPDIAKLFYSISFYQVWPSRSFSFNYPESDFLIKRIDIKPYWSADDLLRILNSSREKDLPFIDDFLKHDNGWIKLFGKIDGGNNSIILKAFDSNDGSFIFLDGSRLWRNYSFSAKIDWIKGRDVSLLARFRDNQNYTMCVFNDNNTKVIEYIDGKKVIIAEKKHFLKIPKEDVQLSIIVKNNNVKCFVNNNLIVDSYLNSILSTGGIGFSIWDPQINNSEIIIKKVSVEEIK